MKNSSTTNYNNNPKPSLPKQTFESFFQSNADDQHSFRFTAMPDRHLSPPPDQSPTISTPYLASSPLSKSPWSSHVAPDNYAYTGLRGSLVREEGHIYSLAANGDLLYTGSESKNIRVWKNQKEFSTFKGGSGLVKAIVIAGEKIFSGHQDGKIRVWAVSRKDPSMHKRIGTMPTFKAKIRSSFGSSIKHNDAISCLSLSDDKSLLYSGSWDKSFKVWRVSDGKCVETVRGAHDDAVNSIIAASGDLVFTGSADGTVKAWKKNQIQPKGTIKHSLSQTLLKQESAVTSLAVNSSDAAFLYCGSSDGLVNFWERGEGGKIPRHGGVLRGHKLAVLCLAASGNLAFSGAADMNICVWRRDGGAHICLSVLIGHTGPVKCLAVEEEKEAYLRGGERQYMVYSGSIDKSVKIWRVSEMAAAMQPPPPLVAPEKERQVEDFDSWADFSLAPAGEVRKY